MQKFLTVFLTVSCLLSFDLLELLQCYLSSGTQVVRINNVLLTPLPVLSGILQGSILRIQRRATKFILNDLF